MGKCLKHDCDKKEKDIGHGKTLPVCFECEKEEKELIRKTFADAPIRWDVYTEPIK